MSRHTQKINEHIMSHYGSDHALGSFLDITDSRYAKSGLDEQGDGYVFEHSQAFPTPNNKVVIDMNKPITAEIIIAACDNYINSLNL